MHLVASLKRLIPFAFIGLCVIICSTNLGENLTKPDFIFGHISTSKFAHSQLKSSAGFCHIPLKKSDGAGARMAQRPQHRIVGLVLERDFCSCNAAQGRRRGQADFCPEGRPPAKAKAAGSGRKEWVGARAAQQ